MSSIKSMVLKKMLFCKAFNLNKHAASRSYHLPMHKNPVLFDVASALPIALSKHALKKHAEKQATDLDKLIIKGSVIDIGCGQGAVSNYLARYLDRSAKLDAFDMSEGVIQYAKEHYADNKINFFTMDASGAIPNEMKNKYDLATCFSVLHWTQEVRKVLSNIQSLMKPNGDALFVTFNRNSMYVAWRELAKTSKWAPYCKDVNTFIGHFQDLEKPGQHLKDMMLDSGYKNVDVSLEEYNHDYQEAQYDMKVFRDVLTGLNPFVLRMSNIEEQNAYMDDLIKVLINLKGFKNLDSLTKYKGGPLEMNFFSLIVATGSK